MSKTRDRGFTHEGTLRTPEGVLTVEGTSPEAVADGLAAFKAAQETERFRQQRWGGGGLEGMERLCALFPSLRDVPGTAPWDVDRLLEWLIGAAPTSGSRHAAMFVLSVWDPRSDWKEVVHEKFAPRPCEACRGSGYVDEDGNPAARNDHGWRRCSGCDSSGRYQPTVPSRFDMFGALQVWDHAHHRAFMQWVEAPFWP